MRVLFIAGVLLALLSVLNGGVYGDQVSPKSDTPHPLVQVQFTHVTLPDGKRVREGRELSKIFPVFVVESGQESLSTSFSDARLARKVMTGLIRNNAVAHFEMKANGQKLSCSVPLGKVVDTDGHALFYTRYEFVFTLGNRNGVVEAFNILPSTPARLSVSDAIEIEYSCSWAFQDDKEDTMHHHDPRVQACLEKSGDEPEETLRCLEEVIVNLTKELEREKRMNRRKERRERKDREDRENTSEEDGKEDNGDVDSRARQYDYHHHKHHNVPFFIVVVFLIFVVIIIRQKRRRDRAQRRGAHAGFVSQPAQPAQPVHPVHPVAPVAPPVYVLPPPMDAPPIYPSASQYGVSCSHPSSHPPPPPPRAQDTPQYHYGMQPYDTS